ncbi:MAG: flagellar filament capping protein FliD [Planctomycetota bacterium]
MSSIQSSVGLITGIPIQDTVDQLIAISARPRDALVARTNGIQAEQAAVDTLSSLVLSLQFSANRFNAASTFTGRTASSSSTAVSVSIPNGSTPPPGSYQFTPLQAASAHQFVSSSIDDITDAIGDGTLRFGFGGRVDKGLKLADLNDGDGVAAGEIKVTDRSGASAVIDLRAAQTVDEVLLAINSSADISVSATTAGDSFVLTDNSGGAGSLSVVDIGLGTTAADLGLGGLSTTTDTLTGGDVYDLSSDTKLSALNDGNGVYFQNDLETVQDLEITLQDGVTTLAVDLSGSTTLGDVVDAINNNEDNAGKLTAAIGASGLTLTDTTTGSGTLAVTSVGGSAAEDLGLAVAASGNVINGARIAPGLRDTLVSSLNGGAGITLGEISITDRAGTVTTIDLSGLETLSEIVDQINTDALAGSNNVTARINDNRNGIVLEDSVGGGGNLIVADSDANNTATALGIVADVAAGSVNSGALNRQTVSESTLLTDFNGGSGVSLGDFFVTDSDGVRRAVDLNTSGSEATTIGDVIDRINALGNGVQASINATGDGIQIVDTAGGDGTLTVTESGTGTTAADLKLVGASTATNDSDQQIIDGSTSYSVDLTDLTQSAEAISLSTLNSGAGVDLGIFNVVAADGQNFTVNLGEAGSEAFTVGDVINLINESATEKGIDVVASVNEAGTGIALTDNTGGSGELTVEDLGTGSAAADLNLIRTAADGEDDLLDGAGLFSAVDSDAGALETLATRINELGAGVTATIFTDSSGSRLAITANETGSANELLIDGGLSGLSFQETSRPADAVALFGSSSTGGGFAVTSDSNEFNGVVAGLDITVNEATGETTTIEVATDDSPFIDAVQGFVDAYNSVRTNLDTVTAFDEETLSTGLLFGRVEALRVDTELSRLVSGRLAPGAKFGSLESVGVSLDDDGKLTLDTTKLRDAFAEDPTGVESLFTDDQDGLVANLTTVVDTLAGDENSLLASRSDALDRTINSNNDRITRFSEQLTRERDRLLLEFFRLEETIALLQSNQTSIDSIQNFSFAASSSNSN